MTLAPLMQRMQVIPRAEREGEVLCECVWASVYRIFSSKDAPQLITEDKRAENLRKFRLLIRSL